MIANILKIKLEAIDADCESSVELDINKLYAEARYDGSRFCVPSFQTAGNLWLGLIAGKERDFVAEIAKVLKTPGVMVTKDDMAGIRAAIEVFFVDGFYLNRMQIFSEGVARIAASYGGSFDPAVHRVDLRDAAYRAAATNALRRARATIFAELELQNQSSTPDIVRAVARWWLYFRAHPFKALTAVIVLVLLPWLMSKINVAEILSRV